MTKINKKSEVNYNGSQIDVLEGLEAVRIRPGMYIGSTGSKGLHHCIWEILDNGIDEALAGFCDTIKLTINKDNSISIEDNGRGIPIDNHPKLDIPTVRVIYTVLHAGGKFRQGVYKKSGGLHGVGASVVNALSKWVEVEVYRDGKIYIDRYECGGKPVTKLKKGVLPSIGKTDKRGTKVTFLPDDTIFETTEWKEDIIKQKLKEMSYLNKGIKIIFENKNTDESEVYHEERGLIGFVEELTNDKSNLTDIIYIEGKSNDIEAEIVFRLADEFGEHIMSYCNNISTTEGGTHVTGFKGGLTRLMNNYAKELGYKNQFDGKDIRNGITAIISIKHYNPQYEGQTKTKLGNSDAKNAIEDIMANEGPKFFDRNYETLKTILDNAEKMMKLKQKEEAERNTLSKDKFSMSEKIALCTSKDPKECEIYMVEGDSAGGTAKKGRFRKNQSILPLRGKILNVEKKTVASVLSSEEIRKMINAFGCGYGENIDISKLNYHKIIILTDADIDGCHIRTLLLTFCYRYMKELLLGGYIYIALPPLYQVICDGKNKKQEKVYLYSDKELDDFRKKGKKIKELQRYKGLGEMNYDQLRETVFDPKTRRLVRVTIDDALRAEEITQLLMGSKVEPRKNLIIKEAKNAHIDL